jgi:gluconokinase
VNAINPGVAAVTIGTSGAIRVVTDKPSIDPKGRTFTYALDENHWVVGGPVNNGGDVFRWARDNMFDAEKSTAALLGKDDYDLLTEIAGKVPAGADGLLFHPYLGGERAPIWDANARGSFFGLTHSHTRAHMLRAVLEGIIFNIYMVELALEEVVGSIKELQATGGFARSALWRQMMADIFESDVVVPTAFESGALAATVMAQKALGLIDDISEIKNMIGESKTYSPNPENYEVYRELAPIFIRLSRQLQTEYTNIADFQKKHNK